MTAREMLLLGAGASRDAKIPTAFEMSTHLYDAMVSDIHRRAIALVMGGLLFRQAAAGVNPLEQGVDVEALFSAVELLSQRQELDAAPFIGAWHYAVDELDRADALGRSINWRTHSSSYVPGVGTLPRVVTVEDLKEVVNLLLSPSGTGGAFRDTKDAMIKALREVVWIEDPSRVSYLTPLLRLLRRQGRLVVATLNYDNVIELLAESHHVPCRDGLDEWARSGTFHVDGDGLVLLKLHGSINWELTVDTMRRDRLPHTQVVKHSPDEMTRGEIVEYQRPDGTKESFRFRRPFTPALIFGKGNKLTAEGPFLDLLRAFRDELSGVEVLTVIGYSFRDSHVNEYLTRWLNADPNHKMRIINGGRFEEKTMKTGGYARDLLTHVRHQVEVIPACARCALATLWT